MVSMQAVVDDRERRSGLPVLRTRDVEETARVMLYAARQAQRVGRATAAHGAGVRGIEPRVRQRIRFLMGLPGIGPCRAADLLNAFGSVENVLLADEEELVDVPGISYGTARAIRKIVRDARARYGS